VNSRPTQLLGKQSTYINMAIMWYLYTYFITGNNLLGGYEMDLALRDYLMPKLVASGIDLMAEGYQQLYLMFMRNLKKAKEVLSSLPAVCKVNILTVLELIVCRLL
jgi:hypothetical protein